MFFIVFLFEIISVLGITVMAGQGKLDSIKKADKGEDTEKIDKKLNDSVKLGVILVQIFWTAFVVFMFVLFYFNNSKFIVGDNRFAKINIKTKISYWIFLLMLIFANLSPLFVAVTGQTNITKFTTDGNGIAGLGVGYGFLSFAIFCVYLFNYHDGQK